MSLKDITIGNYHILSTIAYGSFGRVYLARDSVLNRTVALKLMHAVPLSSTEEHQQFLNEAKILELLQHPFILPILDVGIHDGSPYIVSEYAEGGSLRQYLKERRGQPCELEEALTILSQIGQGLQYAHQQNVIHRDIKPENILFNGKGEALLADFGLATMLATASIKYVTSAGTPCYMAPEQFQGKISKETDQYALGCVAYELLTGQAPFDGTDPVTFMYKHVHVMPTSLIQHNSQLSSSTDQAVLKALSKQREDRYADIATFIAALSTSTAPLPLITQPTIAVSSSAEQEATDVSYTTNPSDEVTVNAEIAEENISTVVSISSNGHVQGEEKLPSPAIVQTEQPTSSTIALEDHSTLPVQHETVSRASTGVPTSLITKRRRRVYAVVATLLALVFVASSSLWVWQMTQSAKTTASSVTSGTTMPTLTIVVSPTTVPTSTPMATATPTTAAKSAVGPISPTATPMPPTATPIPPTATPIPPTATPRPPTPTQTPVPLKLAASPSNLSGVTSQCPYNGSSSGSSWTCTVTLSASSGKGSVNWSISNAVQWCRGSCQPASSFDMTISPSSGTLNAGGTVQVSIVASGCYPGYLNGSIIFSGPANTITIPFNCSNAPA